MVVAEDLSPADTAVLDLTQVLGIVIEKGGRTSHTAIIAGQLGPAVRGARDARPSSCVDGDEVAVDAARGHRDRRTGRRRCSAAVAARRAALAALARGHADGATSDGHGVQLLANIGTAEDAERLDRRAVQGVGLFRTEVLFLGRPDRADRGRPGRRVRPRAQRARRAARW